MGLAENAFTVFTRRVSPGVFWNLGSPGGPKPAYAVTAAKPGARVSIGDVVELVELLCQAILSTPGKGGKTEGKSTIPRGTAWCND